MKLVIAEKPSVAQSLAKVIGADKRQEGYLEGGGYLVSWCVGHLVELSAPECYDERFSMMAGRPAYPAGTLALSGTGRNIMQEGCINPGNCSRSWDIRL